MKKFDNQIDQKDIDKIMEGEGQVVNKQKIMDTVQKYVELIKQNKIYEFTQKIDLLAHRKQQSKRFEQAQYFLFCAIQKLFLLTSQQSNEAYSLLNHLLKIYEGHPEIWNLEKGKKIFQLLNIKSNDKKYEYYVRFMKTLKNKPFPRDLVLDLIGYYLKREEYTKAESHVLELDLQYVKNFCEKWCVKVSSQEAVAIQCRLALLRGLFANFDQCDELLQGADRNSPFFRFSNFLISASKLKSRQAYNLLGSRYKQFLESDEMYNKIYMSYGAYFFKIDQQSKGSGLMSLFS